MWLGRPPPPPPGGARVGGVGARTGSGTHHFHAHSAGAIIWPHLSAREAGGCSVSPGRGENGSPWTAGGLCQTELSQILSFDFTCGVSRIASTRIGNVALFEWGMRVNTHTHTQFVQAPWNWQMLLMIWGGGGSRTAAGHRYSETLLRSPDEFPGSPAAPRPRLVLALLSCWL